MKIITQIEATLDLKSILAMSGGTITRHITLFVGADHKDLPAIMQAARDARDLFRNDADMTMRLIAVRPDRADDYKQGWATAAEKQLLNVYGLIKEAFEAEGRELTFEPADEPAFVPEEITNWTTPAPKQQEHPGEPLIPEEMKPKEDPAPEPELDGSEEVGPPVDEIENEIDPGELAIP